MPKNSLLPEWVRKVLESVILRFLITAKRLEKSPETDRFQDFSGCGGRTRTYGLRVMRQSQAQIGVISAPICAFYHHSLGEFSIVSVQPCPLFSCSGAKLGQDMRKPETYRNEIKSYIIRTGMTMTEVVDYLSDEYGWSRSVPNLSGKLKRGSLRYGEAVELADALGYDIVWEKR